MGNKVVRVKTASCRNHACQRCYCSHCQCECHEVAASPLLRDITRKVQKTITLWELMDEERGA